MEPFELTPWQAHCINAPHRYKVVVAGRRSGKTVFARMAAFLHAYNNHGSHVWICALSYGQCKKLYWNDLVGQNGLIPEILIARKSIVELTIELINGSVIELKGTNNVDTLLGSGLDLLIIDETQSHSPVVFDLLTPMLADRKGKMIMIGTPRRYNHFYEYFQKGWFENDNRDDRWLSYQIKTIDAGTIDAEEIENAKERMSESVFRQEFEASFEAVKGLVYHSFTSDNIVKDIELDKNKPLLIGMDFNVNPMTAVVFQRQGPLIYALDEFYLENSNTPHMADEIMTRYGGIWRSRIHLYPDPSGSSRTAALKNGGSNFSILRGAPYNYTVVSRPGHPAIEDRINSVNSMFCSATGQRRLFVHPRCKNLLKTIRGLSYDEKTGKPGKGQRFGDLDHMSDAMGYPVEYMFPIGAIVKQSGIHTGTRKSILEEYGATGGNTLVRVS